MGVYWPFSLGLSAIFPYSASLFAGLMSSLCDLFFEGLFLVALI